MKVYLTGTQSFVGQEFLRLARSKGLEVYGCDSTLPSDPAFSQCDIRSSALSDLIPEGVDAVVHLAALSTDKQCFGDLHKCFDVNVQGTLNVMRAAQLRKAKHFVFASSEWVYGETNGCQEQTEDQLLEPGALKTEYALSKQVCESVLRQQYGRGFCSTSILRFAIIYGSRKEGGSAVESLFNAVRTQDVVKVGALKTARRFIHVKDIAAGILAGTKSSGFEFFNLSGDKLVSLQDIIQVSAELLNRKPQMIEDNPAGVNIRNPSNAKAARMLGWRPALSLKDGLRTLMETDNA